MLRQTVDPHKEFLIVLICHHIRDLPEESRIG
jgi:hypothetical protein